MTEPRATDMQGPYRTEERGRGPEHRGILSWYVMGPGCGDGVFYPFRKQAENEVANLNAAYRAGESAMRERCADKVDYLAFDDDGLMTCGFDGSAIRALPLAGGRTGA